MSKFKSYVKNFIFDESGDQLVEYAIIIAIAAGLIVAVNAISRLANDKMDDAYDQLEDAGEESGTGTSTESGGIFT